MQVLHGVLLAIAETCLALKSCQVMDQGPNDFWASHDKLSKVYATMMCS